MCTAHLLTVRGVSPGDVWGCESLGVSRSTPHPQGCARFPGFVQNFSERQILWSLCSVDFHTFTLQLLIQTPRSVALALQVLVSSHEKCQNFSKMSTPQAQRHPPPSDSSM